MILHSQRNLGTCMVSIAMCVVCFLRCVVCAFEGHDALVRDDDGLNQAATAILLFCRFRYNIYIRIRAVRADLVLFVLLLVYMLSYVPIATPGN